MTEWERNRSGDMDAALDRALASYTPAKPPAGLERRLSARLAAVVPDRRREWRDWRWAWAACAVAAAALVIAGVHSHRRIDTEARVRQAPSSRPAEARRDIHREEAFEARLPARATLKLRRRRVPVPDADETGLSEMRAPSRPAPPAPLTAEERLLLRVVRHRDPEQMAILNPAVRESKAAESDREFESFVGKAGAGNE